MCNDGVAAKSVGLPKALPLTPAQWLAAQHSSPVTGSREATLITATLPQIPRERSASESPGDVCAPPQDAVPVSALQRTSSRAPSTPRVEESGAFDRLLFSSPLAPAPPTHVNRLRKTTTTPSTARAQDALLAPPPPQVQDAVRAPQGEPVQETSPAAEQPGTPTAHSGTELGRPLAAVTVPAASQTPPALDGASVTPTPPPQDACLKLSQHPAQDTVPVSLVVQVQDAKTIQSTEEPESTPTRDGTEVACSPAAVASTRAPAAQDELKTTATKPASLAQDAVLGSKAVTTNPSTTRAPAGKASHFLGKAALDAPSSRSVKVSSPTPGLSLQGDAPVPTPSTPPSRAAGGDDESARLGESLRTPPARSAHRDMSRGTHKDSAGSSPSRSSPPAVDTSPPRQPPPTRRRLHGKTSPTSTSDPCGAQKRRRGGLQPSSPSICESAVRPRSVVEPAAEASDQSVAQKRLGSELQPESAPSDPVVQEPSQSEPRAPPTFRRLRRGDSATPSATPSSTVIEQEILFSGGKSKKPKLVDQLRRFPAHEKTVNQLLQHIWTFAF